MASAAATRRKKSKSESSKPKRDEGCPIPLLGGCTSGFPLPTSETGGIRLFCSNANCKYAGQLMHSTCVDKYEQYLVKLLGNSGSARGWTEVQKWSNLWEKKGLGLIQKYARCLCGLGVVHRDVEAEKKAAMAAENANGQLKATANGKKKKHNNNLPKLNPGPIGVSNHPFIPPYLHVDASSNGGNNVHGRRRTQSYRHPNRDYRENPPEVTAESPRPLPWLPTLADFIPGMADEPFDEAEIAEPVEVEEDI